jgi:hypothetical protein
MSNYRKAIGSVVWHFSSNCTTWPINNYIVSENPQDGEICSECTALHALRVRTCPVIVNKSPCGLELMLNSDGFHYCPVGHRTHIVEINSK